MLVELYVTYVFAADYEYIKEKNRYGYTKPRVSTTGNLVLNNQDTYICVFSAGQRHYLKFIKESPDFKIIYEAPSAKNTNYPYRKTEEEGNVLVVFEFIGKEHSSATQHRALVAEREAMTQGATTSSSSKTEDNTASPVAITEEAVLKVIEEMW